MAAYLHGVAGSRYVKQVQTNKRLAGEHLISHPDDTEKFSLRAAIVLGTGEFLFLDKANKHIKLVDTNFKCVSVMKFKTCPFDICASNKKKSEFYVTEPEEQSIHCIMAVQGRITKCKSWSIFEDCRGITCWKSGIALTVMRDGFKGTLGFLDYDCKIKMKVCETELQTHLFRAPWYLDSIRGGTLVVVSDQGNNSVICIEANSLNVIFIFKNENLIGPRTLTVDAEDNIYVIGSSEACHNVVKISPEGKMRGIIVSRKDQLNYPSGIAYSVKAGALVLQGNREKSTVCIYTV